MAKLSDLALDLGALDGGQWIDLATREAVRSEDREPDRVYLHVGSRMSARWTKAVMDASRDLPEGVTVLPDDVTARIVVEALFFGFSGIEDDAGEALETTFENRLMIMTDPRYEFIRRAVNSAGNSEEERVRRAAEGIRKN
jgi:hypothetical protein